VAKYRSAGDRWTTQGVPAHITIAGPWPLSQAMPTEHLARVVAAVTGTRYCLDRLGMLGDALCLFPSDVSPLLAVRVRVIEAVGAADAVTAAWRLHLTIARTQRSERIEEVRRGLGQFLPLSCELRDLCLARLLTSGHVTIAVL
jgi:hypothetical protein